MCVPLVYCLITQLTCDQLVTKESILTPTKEKQTSILYIMKVKVETDILPNTS